MAVVSGFSTLPACLETRLGLNPFSHMHFSSKLLSLTSCHVIWRRTGQVYPRRRLVRGGPRRRLPPAVPAQHFHGRVEVQRGFARAGAAGAAAASLGGLTEQLHQVRPIAGWTACAG